MSSVVSRPFAQRTGNFVVTAYGVDGILYSNCYIQLESDIAQWASDNAGVLTVVGNVYISSVANYRSVVQDLWYDGSYYNVPEYPNELLPIGMELKDMGKDIYIGVPGEANLLHLRLVQLPGALDALGRGASSGYVVVEGNADIFSNTDYTYPTVSVARL